MDMARFTSRDDQNFITVANEIGRWARETTKGGKFEMTQPWVAPESPNMYAADQTRPQWPVILKMETDFGGL